MEKKQNDWKINFAKIHIFLDKSGYFWNTSAYVLLTTNRKFSIIVLSILGMGIVSKFLWYTVPNSKKLVHTDKYDLFS